VDLDTCSRSDNVDPESDYRGTGREFERSRRAWRAPYTDLSGVMTARPSLEDATALLSQEALDRLRARPGFRAAVEQFTAEALKHARALDATGLWMLADMGRTAIYMTAVLMDAQPGGVSVAAMAAISQETGATSRGRVAQFVNFALDAGEITLPPGADHWTRRRLILRPAFIDRLRRRSIIEARAIARFAPEIAALPDKLEDMDTYRRLLNWLVILLPTAPYSGLPSTIELFLNRECGMRILQHLTLDQAPDRVRILESAPISRNRLSQTYGVSRAHINRLLADAEALGLLSLTTPRRVEFSPALSDDYERSVAQVFQLFHAAYLATLATEPAGGG
jgi:hypothetical protein